VIEHATVGPNVSLGAGSTVRNATVRDTIAGLQVTISNASLHDAFLGDHVRVQGVSGSMSIGDHSEIRGEG
jgi:glucose-1-phosphate thymidylyltransferase